jgi:hypothetical protein
LAIRVSGRKRRPIRGKDGLTPGNHKKEGPTHGNQVKGWPDTWHSAERRDRHVAISGKESFDTLAIRVKEGLTPPNQGKGLDTLKSWERRYLTPAARGTEGLTPGQSGERRT